MDNTRLITQAVILAGGRGERLRPLTDNIPKPMAPIGDKPFVWFLCKQMANQGIKQIYILAGYLAEKIESWAAQTELSQEIEIKVFSSPAEWDPLKRLNAVKTELAEKFFLLYGDNFISCNYKKIENFFSLEPDCCNSLLIYKKSPGNIQINENSKLITYKSKRDTQSTHLDLGFMAVNTKNFFDLSKNYPTLQSALENISNHKQLIGIEHLDSYQSISDYQRYLKTCDFLRPKKIIILDRDGTINKKAETGKYITDAKDLLILESAKKGIRKLAEAGFRFAIISNQAGIATGDLTEKALSEINLKLIQEFKILSAEIVDILICSEHWQNTEHPDRKPQAGLFFKLSANHNLRLDDTFYIGDDPRDVQAAWNANCRAAFIGNKEKLLSLSQEMLPQIIAENFEQAADQILNFYSDK